MSIDNKSLIRQVRARPALWNRLNADYGQKTATSKLWTEIAAFHGVHESSVKAKWKALRDTFRQELKKSIQPTTWTFYADMAFIKGHMKTNRWSKPDPQDLEMELEANAEPGPEPDADVFAVKAEPPDGPPSPFPGEDADGSPGPFEPDAAAVADWSLGGLETNDDYHFLMSFLAEMKKLHPKKKMLLRIKMMELFYNEIYKADVD